MLIEARITATKPKTRAQTGPEPRPGATATPTDNRPPTTITDEMAFVTDISGVCSAGVTAHTT